MKRIISLAVIFPVMALAASATYTSLGSRSFKAECASGTCDAPAGTSQTMDLTGVGSITVTLCAATGATLSGAGTVRAYSWVDSSAPRSRNPDLDLAVSVTAATAQCQTWPAIYVPGPRGLASWVVDGVTTSNSGATTIYVMASAPVGGNNSGGRL